MIKTRPHNSLFDLALGLGTVNKHLSFDFYSTLSKNWISKDAVTSSTGAVRQRTKEIERR